MSSLLPAEPAGERKEHAVEIRIGVTYTPKEVNLELADDVSADSVKADVNAALALDDGVLWVTDKKGRQVGVPSSKIAYVEIGHDETARPIGFG